jgi:hypothetical protein
MINQHLAKDRIDLSSIPDRVASSGYVANCKMTEINGTIPESMESSNDHFLDNPMEFDNDNTKVAPLINATHDDDPRFYSGNLKKNNRGLTESKLVKSYSTQFEDNLKLSSQSTAPLNSLFAEFITKIRFR